MKSIIYIFAAILIMACSTPQKEEQASKQESNHSIKQDDVWRFAFQMQNEELPFLVDFKNMTSENPEAHVHLGEKVIVCKNFKISGDSIFMTMPNYDTYLKGKIESEDLITGVWVNPISDVAEDYELPFVAEKGKNYKFTPAASTINIPDRYKITMYAGSDRERNYVLKITQTPNDVKAAIMTESGDYGYLEGNIANDKLYVGSFDGAYAYLLTAKIQGDSLVDGKFFSGYHHQSAWHAEPNTEFELRDPLSLTFLKDGYDKIDFKLPNQDGDTVTWNDLNLENKVVVLDIMGSWCPNCLDAGVALKELASKYDEKEIELLSIAFERTEDLEVARRRVFNVQNHLGLQNRFLFGGKVSRESTEKALPMINRIMSYPTIIFISKDRKVQEIYTGFYGPGTGEKYQEFMDETQALLDKMVSAAL